MIKPLFYRKKTIILVIKPLFQKPKPLKKPLFLKIRVEGLQLKYWWHHSVRETFTPNEISIMSDDDGYFIYLFIYFILQKLEFTLAEEPRSPDAKSMSIEKIQEELHRLIVNQNANNEEIFDWIEVNYFAVK